MSAPPRSGVVLAVGVLTGAGLVELGSLMGQAPSAPPIVMVVKSPPEPEPMPFFVAPLLPPTQGLAPAALQATPVAEAAVQLPGAGLALKQPVARIAAKQQTKAAATRPVAKVAAKTARVARARRTALSQLPEGVVVGLRRSGDGATGAVARELVAGARALERGTAYTAWAHFTRALVLDHDNRDALMGVALCHYELDQKRAADRALTRLLALDPTHPEASILRGFIAQLAGDQAAAIEWYERALPRLTDDAVADELRAVIAWLRPQLSFAPSATARVERPR